MKQTVTGLVYGFMLFVGVLLALPGQGHFSLVAYTGSCASLRVESSGESAQHPSAQVTQINYGLSDLLHDVTLEPVVSSCSSSSTSPLARRHQGHSFSYIGLGSSTTDSPKTLHPFNTAALAANLKSVETLDPTQYYIYTLHRIRI